MPSSPVATFCLYDLSKAISKIKKIAANGKASESAVNNPIRTAGSGESTRISIPNNHSHQSSYSKNSKAPDLDFGDKQSDGKQNQKHAHIVDGKKRKTENRKQKTNAADHSRRDKSRVSEFKIKQDQPHHSEKQRQVRLSDRRQQFFARSHLVVDNGLALRIRARVLRPKTSASCSRAAWQEARIHLLR